MKRILPALPLIAAVIALLIMVSVRLKRASMEAQSTDPTEISMPDPLAFDYPPSFRTNRHPSLAVRKRAFKYDEELTPEDNAMDKAMQERDSLEFHRLFTEHLSRPPWEYEPPWLQEFNKKWGYTNDFVVTHEGTMSAEETDKAMKAIEESMRASRDWRPGMPIPPAPKIQPPKPPNAP